MNIDHIQEKLNALFQEESSHRKLVLWYDDKGDFADDIEKLELVNAKVVCLNGHNSVTAKHRILREERETNFLIYAPFPKPRDDDETNHFLDISFYATPFYADALYDVCTALAIPTTLKPVLAEGGRFWKSDGNIRKVQALHVRDYTADTVRHAVMAVLCNVKTLQLNELMKAVLRTRDFHSDTNRILKKFRTAHVEDAFWRDVSVEYGYVWPEKGRPSLTDFVIHCVASYWAQTVGDIPSSWPGGQTGNTTAAVFWSNVMTHEQDRVWVDEVLQRLSVHLGIEKLMRSRDLSRYASCDLFRVIDEALIGQLAQLLATSPREFNERELACIQFRKTTAHYADVYAGYYRAVEGAHQLGKAIRSYEEVAASSLSLAEMVKAYEAEWYKADMMYRQFYAELDQLDNPDLLGDLPNAVEEAYIHRFIEPFSALWGQNVQGLTSYSELPGMKQADFYSWYVKPKEDTMLAVIISDALRYECGRELYDQMAVDPNMTPKLDSMMANVPTYTQLGMASLLPHKALTIEVSGTMPQVLNDGASTVGAANRERLLQTANKAAKVMHLDDILQASRTDLRHALNGVRLVYIYHDAIDSTGDNMKTEDKVFAAAARGITEIMRCIRKLAMDKSMVHFVVTADHGFLYRRSDVPVYTKVKYLRQGDELYRNKRYILSARPMEQDGIITWPLDYPSQAGYVNMPVGCDIFAMPGGGQHFVHGGVTIQELLIPVVTVRYTKGKVDTTKVAVKWYSPQRRLTEIHNYLQFIQEEAVTDTIKGRTVTVVITDSDGKPLSNEVTILANRTEAHGADRIYTEKFILPERTYTDFAACLIIRDSDDDTVLGQYDIQIDVLQKTWTL